MRKNTLHITIGLIALVVSFGSCTATSKSSKKTEKTIQKSEKVAPKEEKILPKEKAAYIKKYGVPQISFVETDGGLCVNIKTKNLELTSVTMEDFDNYYIHLFGNAKVMEKYAEGRPRSKKRVKNLLTTWVKRWENNNPFSGLVVRRKAQTHQKTGDFLGHVVLGISPEEPNATTLAGLMKPTEWSNHYGYEAAGAIALFYAHELAQRGYKPSPQANFERIVATVRPDNSVSAKILEALGLTVYRQGKPYSDGVTRNYYEVAIDAL